MEIKKFRKFCMKFYRSLEDNTGVNVVGKKEIPEAEFAIIGGSGTFSIAFPEEVADNNTSVLKNNIKFSTPFGQSPPLKLFKTKEKRVLTTRMHGWRSGVSRGEASKQLFWVFKQAGVKTIIAEGGVGSISYFLRPRDILIPHDYLDFSMRKDVGLDGKYLLIMRQPICPRIRAALNNAAIDIIEKKAKQKQLSVQNVPRLFNRAVYAVTDGRHFESPAEVQMLARLGADIVGQSMCPEVYLAREIGACYGRLDIVVNYAEGIVKEWDHEELTDIFYNEARDTARILLLALDKLSAGYKCECIRLRKPTLLQENN